MKRYAGERNYDGFLLLVRPGVPRLMVSDVISGLYVALRPTWHGGSQAWQEHEYIESK